MQCAIDKLWYKKIRSRFLWRNKYYKQLQACPKKKVSAITGMAAQTYKKQVQLFIAMIIYLLKFSARLSELAEPIKELSKDKVPFKEAFKLMKKEIARAPVFVYYNPRKQTALQIDTSIKGLGACLLQEENQYTLPVKL